MLGNKRHEIEVPKICYSLIETVVKGPFGWVEKFLFLEQFQELLLWKISPLDVTNFL